MQDDDVQAPKATQLLESLTVNAPGYVQIVAMIELFWVLSSCYNQERSQLVEALEGLLQT